MTKRQLIEEYKNGIYGSNTEFDYNAWLQKCWDNGYEPNDLEGLAHWEMTMF